MKYIITTDCMTYRGVTVCKIRALTSFGDVSAGDYGGYIESESNLSQSGDAWVYPPAIVYGRAKVYENGKMRRGVLYGNGRLYGSGEMDWEGDSGGCYGSAHFGLNGGMV